MLFSSRIYLPVYKLNLFTTDLMDSPNLTGRLLYQITSSTVFWVLLNILFIEQVKNDPLPDCLILSVR